MFLFSFDGSFYLFYDWIEFHKKLRENKKLISLEKD